MRKSQHQDPLFAANEFISARYAYSSIQIDILVRLIQVVNNSDYTVIQMKFDHFLDDARSNSHSIHADLRKALTDLLSNPLEIYNPDEDSFTIANIISLAKVYKKTNTVMISIDPFMVQYFRDLKKNYTSMEIHSILKMRSMYAKRIYMMVRQFVETKSFSIQLEELRKRLKVEAKYKDYHDFERKIIRPALVEINELTELKVDLIEKERGTYSIEKLRFFIDLKGQFEQFRYNEKQAKFLKDCGLSEWQIENVVLQRTPEELVPILQHIWTKLKSTSKISNRGAYVAACLENAGINVHKQLPRQLSII